MNAHTLACETTRDPDRSDLDEWITYCAAIQCAWGALDAAVRSEVGG